MQHVWGRGEVYTGFWWGNLREINHMDDTGVGGTIIFSKCDVWGMDWIELAQDSYRWREQVNTVKKLRVP
jgi:hypothetical protein